jgi:phospholipid transport system substrate-binding protein
MSPIQTLSRLVVTAAAIGALAGPTAAQDVAAVNAAAPAVGAVSPDGRAAQGPEAVVTTLQNALLTVMKRADELGFEGRYEYLQPVVAETFDVPFMASKSVGRHWNELTPEERADWQSKFTGYLAANYAGNFTGWDGESFEVVGEQEAPRDTRVVLTELHVPGGEDVVLNYRLRADADGRWRIIDIYLKGTVSELALRRSDFSTTLKDKGFAELSMAIDRKIDDLRKKGGG